jgi:hypothetical protein
MGMAMASFEAGFDPPYLAIRFSLLVGMAMAPGCKRRTRWVRIPPHVSVARQR